MRGQTQNEEKGDHTRRMCGRQFVPERSTKRERSSKRHDVRSRVSSEDTRSSGSRVREEKSDPLGC
jgi:hypothetical protein